MWKKMNTKRTYIGYTESTIFKVTEVRKSKSAMAAKHIERSTLSFCYAHCGLDFSIA
jgi:hypothetical protein